MKGNAETDFNVENQVTIHASQELSSSSVPSPSASSSTTSASSSTPSLPSSLHSTDGTVSTITDAIGGLTIASALTATTASTTTSSATASGNATSKKKNAALSPTERVNRCFSLLQEAIIEQKEQALIPIENIMIVTKDILTLHMEKLNHEITKFVVLVTQSPDTEGIETLSKNLLNHVDAYLSIHRVLLLHAGATKKNVCVKTVHGFLNSLQVVLLQAQQRLIEGDSGGEGKTQSKTAPVFAVETKGCSKELGALNAAGVSLASHTGACLEACKALAAVPLTNLAAVTKVLLSLLSLVKDAKGEINEILEEQKAGGGEAEDGDEDGEDEDEKLSPADLKRVKLATELSNLVYSTIRKLYEFSLRCTTLDSNPGHVAWLEEQVQASTRLSTALDNLGSTLYGPQDVDEVRNNMTAVGQELDGLLARFSSHPEFYQIFKLTFPAKEQQEQDPEKIAAACDLFISKCRAATEKVVKQC